MQKLRAEIARLNTGLGQQDVLLRRTQELRGSIEKQTESRAATRDSLEAESRELRKKMAGDGPDADNLKQQLVDTQKRLKLLENEGKIAETVVQSYGPSVCLLHVVVEFLDKQTGKSLQVGTRQAD